MQPGANNSKRYSPEIVTLKPREDRFRHLLRFGGCQDNLDVRWWLFDGFQQCIEGLVGELVGFVDDVDLEPITGRTITQIFDDRAGVVDFTVSRAINLNHIERIAGANLLACRAIPAGFRGGPLCTIQAARQNPRRGGLADPANPGKQKRMSNAAAF